MDDNRYAKEFAEAAAKIGAAFGDANVGYRAVAQMQAIAAPVERLNAQELVPVRVYVGNRAKRRSDAAKARRAF